MKKLSGCLLFVILCLVSAKENAFAQTKEKDVIYRFKYFLIHAKDTMKIGFIIKKKSSERESEDEDILYEDNKYLILGNKDKLGYDARFGVYRKYRLSYRFSGFKVKVYKGRLAPPDFKSNPEAFTFRTQIKSQCKADGINFAGHFTIAHWGCGSECEDIAVIDRINGKIYYSNLFIFN